MVAVNRKSYHPVGENTCRADNPEMIERVSDSRKDSTFKSFIMRGFFGIGCYGMKTAFNYGTLFRTAQVFGADFLFLIGNRFKRQASDTMKSYRHIPTYEFKDFDDFNEHRPYGCNLVGVELVQKATALKNFIHPEQACYLLGAEDHGLPPKILDKCESIIVLPGDYSLNVAVAGSIVIYDRISKSKQ